MLPSGEAGHGLVTLAPGETYPKTATNEAVRQRELFRAVYLRADGRLKHEVTHDGLGDGGKSKETSVRGN